jgi:hypothetical protein
MGIWCGHLRGSLVRSQTWRDLCAMSSPAIAFTYERSDEGSQQRNCWPGSSNAWSGDTLLCLSIKQITHGRRHDQQSEYERPIFVPDEKYSKEHHSGDIFPERARLGAGQEWNKATAVAVVSECKLGNDGDRGERENGKSATQTPPEIPPLHIDCLLGCSSPGAGFIGVRWSDSLGLQ